MAGLRNKCCIRDLPGKPSNDSKPGKPGQPSPQTKPSPETATAPEKVSHFTSL